MGSITTKTHSEKAINESLHQEGAVLVVDDNDISRKLLCTYLQAMNYATLAAANGREALYLIDQHKISLILMDLRMPVMNGYETAQSIRTSDNPYRNVPIIGLSADSLNESLGNALRAGMNEYLIKPIKRDDLEELLKKWLNNSQANHTAEPSSVSLNSLRTMLVKELPDFRALIHEYLVNKDYKDLYETAHKIAGGSAYCETPLLESAARKLEHAVKQNNPSSITRCAETLIQVIDHTLQELQQQQMNIS